VSGHVAAHIDQMQSAAGAENTKDLRRRSGFRFVVEMVQHH
jgi:hypothetical protein